MKESPFVNDLGITCGYVAARLYSEGRRVFCNAPLVLTADEADRLADLLHAAAEYLRATERRAAARSKP